MASDCRFIVVQDQTPAGWYQAADGGWRYWDGTAWAAVSRAASNAWPAPGNVTERALRKTSPTISRGQAALATVCILLSLALLGAMAQQPKARTVVVGTTFAPQADASTSVGTSAPAIASTVASLREPTTVTTAAVLENTVLAASATPAATTPPLQASTSPATVAATTAAPTTEVATTVAPTTAPTYSLEQIAYFDAIAQAATSTTQPAVVAPPSTGCGAGAYSNSNGSCVPRPIAASTAPAGATARCNDGTYSFSQTHSGTCSHHKGVAEWLQ
jgi:Protein of unknown function (DUF3761)